MSYLYCTPSSDGVLPSTATFVIPAGGNYAIRFNTVKADAINYTPGTRPQASVFRPADRYETADTIVQINPFDATTYGDAKFGSLASYINKVTSTGSVKNMDFPYKITVPLLGEPDETTNRYAAVLIDSDNAI